MHISLMGRRTMEGLLGKGCTPRRELCLLTGETQERPNFLDWATRSRDGVQITLGLSTLNSTGFRSASAMAKIHQDPGKK